MSKWYEVSFQFSPECDDAECQEIISNFREVLVDVMGKISERKGVKYVDLYGLWVGVLGERNNTNYVNDSVCKKKERFWCSAPGLGGGWTPFFFLGKES